MMIIQISKTGWIVNAEYFGNLTFVHHSILKKTLRVHFSGQPGIEFSRIDDESLVGSLGYLVDPRHQQRLRRQVFKLSFIAYSPLMGMATLE